MITIQNINICTRTEVDGTGALSLASKPGAVACRQGGDHCFENMSIKFIPEPGEKNIHTMSTLFTIQSFIAATFSCRHLPSYRYDKT